ncbi:Tripartite ATP-independent transporter DctP family solute receptor OS=Castellaniella defragrans OX=75697 GN=HNR28_001846 PE=3 SV=1 [Castellaniella defragrans]
MNQNNRISRIRRSLLKTGVALGASPLAILHWRLADAAEFTLKLGNDQPNTHPQNIRVNEAIKHIAEETHGRVAIRLYPNSALGGDTQMFAQLRSGALEIMQISDLIVSDTIPEPAIACIPFAFSSSDDTWKAMDGPLGAYIRKRIEDKLHLHPFGKGWDAGFRNVFTNSKPVHKAGDMKGLKLRVLKAPILIEFFEAVGSSPVPLDSNQMYTALQTNLVDGAEQPLISIETFKFYETSKYVSMTRHQGTTFETLVNGRTWERIPKDLQEVIERNFNKYALLQREDIKEGYRTLQALLEKQGMKFIDHPDRESFKKIIRDAGLYAKWRDRYGKAAFDLLEQSVGKLT